MRHPAALKGETERGDAVARSAPLSWPGSHGGCWVEVAAELAVMLGELERFR